MTDLGLPEQNITPANKLSTVKTFLSNKRNVAIISVLIIGFLYYAYRNKWLDKLILSKTKEIKDDDDTILDITKDYYILDSNDTKIKINLKEMINLHNFYLQQQQEKQQYEEQQQLYQLQQQQLQLQLQQQQLQKQQLQKQKQKKKIKHPEPEPELEESSEQNTTDEDLTNNELESLRRELAELEKQNNNI
jgi:hypothetical protein